MIKKTKHEAVFYATAFKRDGASTPTVGVSLEVPDSWRPRYRLSVQCALRSAANVITNALKEIYPNDGRFSYATNIYESVATKEHPNENSSVEVDSLDVLKGRLTDRRLRERKARLAELRHDLGFLKERVKSVEAELDMLAAEIMRIERS